MTKKARSLPNACVFPHGGIKIYKMTTKYSDPAIDVSPLTAPREDTGAKGQQGSQTLLRGLDLLDAAMDGPIALPALSAALGLTRSTTHRLANALIERRFLTFAPRLGYKLGPKLLELGFIAQRQVNLVQLARPYLDQLASLTEDTVHLGIVDEARALYLEKISGRRRINISSRVGDRQPMTSTGLGKALLLDNSPEEWRAFFEADCAGRATRVEYELWLERMHGYARAGLAFDLEENEDQIRCVAAPIRDASGGIVGAISVSSAAQYMADDRMTSLSSDVLRTAGEISADLGWLPDELPPARSSVRTD